MITAYDNALAELILDRMAEGEALDKICSTPQFPPRRIVRRWLATVPEFYAKFMQARDLQAESLQDQMISIEQDLILGKIDPKAANAALNSMQFRIQRLCPKRWGNKVEHAMHISSDPDDYDDAQLRATAARAIAGRSSDPVGGPTGRSH